MVITQNIWRSNLRQNCFPKAFDQNQFDSTFEVRLSVEAQHICFRISFWGAQCCWLASSVRSKFLLGGGGGGRGGGLGGLQ